MPAVSSSHYEVSSFGDSGRVRSGVTRPSTVAAERFFADPGDWKTLPRRLNQLCTALNEWDVENGHETLPCSLSSDPAESRRLAMNAAVFVRAPLGFFDSFQKLFASMLQHRQTCWDEGEEMMNQDDQLEEDLRTLGWVRRGGKLGRPLSDALHDTILSHVRETIEGELEDDSLYESLVSWKNAVVDRWVRDLVGHQAYKEDNWSAYLESTISECFCICRIEEMFDIIVDFPNSQCAVNELRQVMDRTEMYSELGEALKTSLTRRLLHPGANTSQIIDVYINTIKVLREIDPSDALLENAAEPVRLYLRGRSDTVRCIITSLTDENAGDGLYEELRRQDARPLEQVELDSDDEEEAPTLDWQPAPSLLQQKGKPSGSRGNGADILSMLVSIYGSKELFVNEYRLMLADKLLTNLDYNSDKAVHTLELLKLRFGEMSMRQCEIMVKDMDDSKRIVSNIHSKMETDSRDEAGTVDAMIISHIFWPALQKEQLKHHPRIQRDLDSFSKEYGKLKKDRSLIWLNQLGTVQLELDVVEEKPDGGQVVETREFSCSPLLATLISHFEDKDIWTSEELSNETGIAEHIIQKRMNFWVSNRVVVAPDSADGGVVQYVLGSRDHWYSKHELDSAVGSMMDEDGSGSQAISVGAQEEEEMEVYESYIVGMLNRLEQLPLDRIHNNLKTFVAGSDHKYDKTPHQLSMFLQNLCKQEKLECGPDGMYKLVRK